MHSLDPLRIAAIPGVTLDVVVTEVVVVASSLLSGLQQTAQQSPQLPKYYREITRNPGSSASSTTEEGSLSENLSHKNIKEWLGQDHCQESIFFWQQLRSELWNERVQDAQWEERLSIEADDADETQYQQRIRNNSFVSPQEILPAPTSLTLKFADMMARAESGDHVAQETLGDMFMDGRVFPKDAQAAIDWYLRANSQRNRSATRRKLRPICYSNHGVTREYLTAVDRHRKAADQGDSTAQCNVGLLHLIVEEHAEAMIWLRKAAEQGNANAYVDIGYLYVGGLGVSKNYAEAMIWYRKAAEQGDALGQCIIGILYVGGLGVSQDYAEAMIWLRKAAKQGDASAQYYIGNLYRRGYGVSQDYAEAMIWYRKAAKQGVASAQYNIGNLYRRGNGVSQDYAEAMIWYRKAAEQGDISAQYHIGSLYRRGDGVSQDYAEAMIWYRKAAEQGDASAQYDIGSLYRDGL
ncbi:hypothetical protein BGZ97_002430, partial [Linnemannia gamsii]